MTVLFLQDYLRCGGTERQTLALANTTALAGHQVTLLTFRPGGPLAPEVLKTGIRWHSLQPLDTTLDWWCPGVRRFLAREKPDVVVLQGRMANCQGWRLRDLPYPFRMIASVRTGKKLPSWYQRTLRCADDIIVNSQETGTMLSGMDSLYTSKTRLVPNGLLLPPAAALPPPAVERQNWREQNGSTDRKTVVLVCGAMFRPEKEHSTLLQWLSQLYVEPVQWQLWLLGDGSTMGATKRLVSRLGMENRVRIFGRKTEAWRWYQAADLAVLASSSESLSNFALEAQACGLPMVARNARGLHESIGHGETGYVVPPHDQSGFLNHLSALIRNPELRGNMGEKARKRAWQIFHPEGCQQRFIDLLRTA